MLGQAVLCARERKLACAVDNKFQPDPESIELCDIEWSLFHLAFGRDGSPSQLS